ncbi:hypothetical protein CYMTET_9014, partial [Cymbomonas tetramitiformis]
DGTCHGGVQSAVEDGTCHGGVGCAMEGGICRLYQTGWVPGHLAQSQMRELLRMRSSPATPESQEAAKISLSPGCDTALKDEDPRGPAVDSAEALLAPLLQSPSSSSSGGSRDLTQSAAERCKVPSEGARVVGEEGAATALNRILQIAFHELYRRLPSSLKGAATSNAKEHYHRQQQEEEMRRAAAVFTEKEAALNLQLMEMSTTASVWQQRALRAEQQLQGTLDRHQDYKEHGEYEARSAAVRQAELEDELTESRKKIVAMQQQMEEVRRSYSEEAEDQIRATRQQIELETCRTVGNMKEALRNEQVNYRNDLSEAHNTIRKQSTELNKYRQQKNAFGQARGDSNTGSKTKLQTRSGVVKQ